MGLVREPLKELDRTPPGPSKSHSSVDIVRDICRLITGKCARMGSDSTERDRSDFAV